MTDRLAGWAADGVEIVGMPASGAGLSPAALLHDLGRRRYMGGERPVSERTINAASQRSGSTP